MRLNTISSSHCILNAKRIHANLNQRCLKEIHINRSEIIITIVSEFLQNQQFYWKILRHPRNGTMPSWKSRNWITVECRQFHRQSDVYTLASGPRNEPIALEFRTDDTRSVYYRSIGGLFVILTPSIPYLSPVPEGISSQWLSRACGWRSRNGIYSLSLSLSLSFDDTEGEFGHRDHGGGMKNGGTKRESRGGWRIAVQKYGSFPRLCRMCTSCRRLPRKTKVPTILLCETFIRNSLKLTGHVVIVAVGPVVKRIRKLLVSACNVDLCTFVALRDKKEKKKERKKERGLFPFKDSFFFQLLL